MRFRRNASIVEAVYLDGTEGAWRAVMALPDCRTTRKPDGIEIAATSGRITAHPGQWITHHAPTGTVRTYSPDHFHAEHEAAG